jgi:hypothetical protein
LKEILSFRLLAQQLSEPCFLNPGDLVSWMGAMQAQDYPMVKWAIGIRSKGFSEASVNEAFDKGEILRTHLLRPTWHIVTAEDISWMIDLSAPRLKSSLNGRHKELGINTSILNKCFRIIEGELSGGNHKTREELMVRLGKDRIDSSENRSSHIMMLAELEKLVCSGKNMNGKPTYALLRERVNVSSPLSKENALKQLALTYFSSHGPATIRDFSWWSGLSAREATNGIEMTINGLISETIGNETYWMRPSEKKITEPQNRLILLPAYDEFVIAYKDRTQIIDLKLQSQAISSNGIFWPVILLDGKAIGTWKRTVKNGKVIIESKFFNKPNKKTLDLFDQASHLYAKFLGKE